MIKTENFRIGDRVKITDVITPEMMPLTYTVVHVGKHTIDIEDINGNRHCVRPEQIGLINPRSVEVKEEQKGRNNVKDAEEAMYYHTRKGNDVMYLIIAIVVAVYLITGAGRVAVVLAMTALVIGILQNLWQGATLELFVRQLDRDKQTDFDEYPDHIANGGWAIYAVKMIIAIMAAVQLMMEVY